LRNAPDDQGANQTVGLYLCLARQDWAAGLPFLTRGADPRLIDAAKLDLSNPTDPKAQHRLGELWFPSPPTPATTAPSGPTWDGPADGLSVS